MEYCGGAADEAQVRLALQRGMIILEERGFSPLAVLTRGDERLTGVCGFRSGTDPEGVELIYHFRRSMWGRGYTSEAVHAALAWARERLAVRPVEASFDPRNPASERILKRAGLSHFEDRWF